MPAALALLFVFGLLLGSYATMLTRRLATGEGGMVSGRSKCPTCGGTLRWFDLVPLFSWLAVGGKCRQCRAPIGWRYPLIELSMGLTFAFSGAFLADVPAALAGDGRALGVLVVTLGLAFACVAVSAYDLERMEIPGRVVWPAVAVAVALAAVGTWFPAVDLLPWRFASGGAWGLPVVDSLLGAALAWAIIGGQAYLSGERIMGKGDGDIALLIGLVCGWKLALVAVWFAYCVGGLVGIFQFAFGKRRETPFGQYLCAGLLLALAFGGKVVAHYAALVNL